jgi:hypothetical protein
MDGSGLATAYVVLADVDLWVFVVLAVAVFVGSPAQGVVALGLVLGSVIGLTAPEPLPGLALWFAMVYPRLTLTRDGRSADARGLAWSLGAPPSRPC